MTGAGQHDDTPYRGEFLAEAEVLLDQAQDALSDLTRQGADASPQTLNALFRSIHSLKGLAAMAGFTGLAAFSHELESLLDGVRMGRVALDEPLLGIVGEGVQDLAALAGRVQAGEKDPCPPAAASERIMKTVAAGTTRVEGAEAGALPIPPEIERTMTEYERHRVLENVRKGKKLAVLGLEMPLVSFDTGLRSAMDEVARDGELIGTFPGGGAGPSKMAFLLLVAIAPSSSLAELQSRTGASSVRTLHADAEGRPEGAAPSVSPEHWTGKVPPDAGAVSIRSLKGTVRVPLEKLGHLLNLAVELSLSRGTLKRSLGRALASSTDRTARFEAQKAFTELDRTVTALGRAALATRLVPVEQLTARLSRVVESLAPALGKDVSFEVFGGETEVDKVLAEELADPLLHIVRNALDHGIELPDERTVAGKPRRGRVALTVESRGRTVLFTLTDDGRGIDGPSLVRRARDSGLLSPNEPDPAEPAELIFLPGFSTAQKVTELSGRGVGLDVVRSNLATLKGAVRVSSILGAGTTFEVEVPATLILVESLVVRAEGCYFAFPTAGIRRAFRVEPGQMREAGGHLVLMDEGVALPVHSLATLLGMKAPGASRGEIVVVAEQGDRRAGFTVSSIEGMEDIIVKPLAQEIPRVREVTGATELPGGSLALTIDTGLLLERVLATDAQAGAPS